jgi:uncharacterized protein YuzE
MKLNYDAEADALYVRFSDERVTESEEARPGLVLDFDSDGHIVAIELLDARRQLDPKALASLQAAE